MVVPSRTNLVTQAGLDDAGVNLDLSVEDCSEIIHGTAAGTKEAPVEYFDLVFGNY